MKVSINQDECIGCGMCEMTCPEVFRMTANELAEVYNQPTAETENSAINAVDNCPVAVIHIEK